MLNPETTRQFKAAGVGVFLFVIVVVVFLTLRPSPSRQTSTGPERRTLIQGLPGITTNEFAEDQYNRIVAVYGPPERDYSTETEVPRPLIPIRRLEYRPEMVMMALFPNTRAGKPPPYNRWGVLGYLDMKTKQSITNYEAEEKLKSRLKP